MSQDIMFVRNEIESAGKNNDGQGKEKGSWGRYEKGDRGRDRKGIGRRICEKWSNNEKLGFFGSKEKIGIGPERKMEDRKWSKVKVEEENPWNEGY